MNYKYTKTPEDYAAFFVGHNKITHPDYEYIFHMDFPRCMIKYDIGLAMFASFEDFYESIAEVQWIENIKPSKEEQEKLLVKAWNFLAIDERINEDEMNEMEDEEDDW